MVKESRGRLLKDVRFNSVFNTDTRGSVDGRKRYENDTKTISVDANLFENGTK